MRISRVLANLAAAFVLFVGATSAASAQIDILNFAGKGKSEAAAEIGAPSKCETYQFATNSEKCFYPGDNEIVFINGMADWITVFTAGPKETRSVPGMLLAVGLEKFEAPGWSRGASGARWENARFKSAIDDRYAKLKELGVFPKAGYVYVNVFTRP